MRFLYEILFSLFAIFYLPVFLIKGKHKHEFFSRFGRVPLPVKNRLVGEKVIWVHAVSVGEVIQAVRLANALRDKAKSAKFVLTTTTLTGRQILEKLKGDEDVALYFPIDFRWCVRAFIRDIHPDALLILETEIWPNLIFELTDRHVPVFIVNGRISDKAIWKYQAMRGFFGPVLNRLSGVQTQDEAMRSRFVSAGARPEIVSVTGNMKFDWEPEHRHEAAVDNLQRHLSGEHAFLCVAGSTHEGEEEILFRVYQTLRPRYPFFRLLIAPRHLERIRSIENKAKDFGMAVTRVSEFLNANAFVGGNSHEGPILLDQMVILASLYRIADVVFIGGSLVKVGGHNPVEPAFYERPILFGPFMNNFREMAEEFKQAKAAVEVQDARALEKELIALIESPEARHALGRAAKQLVFKHQGATRRNAETILSAL